MAKRKLLTLFLIAGLGFVTAYAQGSSKAGAKPAKKIVELKNAQGQSVGTVELKPVSAGVLLKLNLVNLPPGTHAIHIHQNAKCEAPDFKTAGGHFNPSGKHHGLENPEGAHNGDMPNIEINAKGKYKGSITNKSVTLAADAANSLYSNGGTAVVIHAKADDNKSDPAGNAGDRIACGVIVP